MPPGFFLKMFSALKRKKSSSKPKVASVLGEYRTGALGIHRYSRTLLLTNGQKLDEEVSLHKGLGLIHIKEGPNTIGAISLTRVDDNFMARGVSGGALILGINVEKEFQKMGLARRMHEEAEKLIAPHLGVSILYLCPNGRRSRLVAEKMGFSWVMQNGKRVKNSDGLFIMSKTLKK